MEITLQLHSSLYLTLLLNDKTIYCNVKWTQSGMFWSLLITIYWKASTTFWKVLGCFTRESETAEVNINDRRRNEKYRSVLLKYCIFASTSAVEHISCRETFGTDVHRAGRSIWGIFWLLATDVKVALMQDSVKHHQTCTCLLDSHIELTILEIPADLQDSWTDFDFTAQTLSRKKNYRSYKYSPSCICFPLWGYLPGFYFVNWL